MVQCEDGTKVKAKRTQLAYKLGDTVCILQVNQEGWRIIDDDRKSYITLDSVKYKNDTILYYVTEYRIGIITRK
jgi:hypothetical protein